MKSYQGSCVENPFSRIDTLCNIVEGAKRTSKRKFFENCYLEEELIKQIRKFPNDYVFYQYEDIMFYQWSAIEYFYY